MRTERVNLSPEGNELSDAVTGGPVGTGPKTEQLAGLTISATCPKPVSWLRKTLKIFGPGLVTGAADDDPSGIATYSSIGAQFGFSMLWTMPLICPFMAAIQEISARSQDVALPEICGAFTRAGCCTSSLLSWSSQISSI